MNTKDSITSQKIIEKYRDGQRHFTDIDLENENFDGENLLGIIFERCFISSSFRNANLQDATFIDCNLKTSDFSGADCTNAHFENNSLDGALFTAAKIDGINFHNNSMFDSDVSLTDLPSWVK